METFSVSGGNRIGPLGKLGHFERTAEFFFFNIFLLVCPIWLPVFSLFSNEPELGTEIDSGMVMTPFTSSILDETSFEPTTYRS